LAGNLLVLVAVVVAKRSVDQAPKYSSSGEEFSDAYATYQSFGFVLEAGGVGEFKVHPWLSYKVEVFMAIVYIVGLYTACRLSSARALL
jgi:hypothetical protein